MSWGGAPVQPKIELTPQQALADWEKKKNALATAKAEEGEARKLVMALNFKDAKEGVNTIPLNNGYELKGTRKVSRKFIVPKDFNAIGDTQPTIAEAVDVMVEEMRRASNEGAFIAERLVKWTADMSDKEYKALSPELKKIVDKYVISEDAMPNVEIKAPKK